LAEQFANLYGNIVNSSPVATMTPSVTLSVAYTAGAGQITVSSATGLPASGTFSLTILNAQTGAVYLIFRVTSRAGAVLTGAAEGPDASAPSGAAVVGTMITTAALNQIKTDTALSVFNGGTPPASGSQLTVNPSGLIIAAGPNQYGYPPQGQLFTAQTANLAGSFSATVAAGLYRISAVVWLTTPAGTSSTVPSSSFSFTWNGVAHSSIALTATSGVNNTTVQLQAPPNYGGAGIASPSAIFWCDSGITITFSTGGYASTPATTMQYSAAFVLERVF